MGAFFKDLRFALRQLAKAPGFTATAVLTLAVGIGATTAIFTLVYDVLLRPLPFDHPEQLVRMQEQVAELEEPVPDAADEREPLRDVAAEQRRPSRP